MLEHVSQATEMLVHLAALVACLYLCRRVPDVVQFCILVLIAVSMAIYTFTDFLVLYGVGSDGVDLWGIAKVWPVRAIAAGVAHWALLTYIVRQVWLTTGVCAILKSRKAGAP